MEMGTRQIPWQRNSHTHRKFGEIPSLRYSGAQLSCWLWCDMHLTTEEEIGTQYNYIIKSGVICDIWYMDMMEYEYINSRFDLGLSILTHLILPH